MNGDFSIWELKMSLWIERDPHNYSAKRYRLTAVSEPFECLSEGSASHAKENVAICLDSNNPNLLKELVCCELRAAGVVMVDDYLECPATKILAYVLRYFDIVESSGVQSPPAQIVDSARPPVKDEIPPNSVSVQSPLATSVCVKDETTLAVPTNIKVESESSEYTHDANESPLACAVETMIQFPLPKPTSKSADSSPPPSPPSSGCEDAPVIKPLPEAGRVGVIDPSIRWSVPSEYAELRAGNTYLFERLIEENRFSTINGNLHLNNPNAPLRLEWDPIDEPIFSKGVIENYARYFKSLYKNLVVYDYNGRLGLRIYIHKKVIQAGPDQDGVVHSPQVKQTKNWYNPDIVIHPYVQLLFYKLLSKLKSETGKKKIEEIRCALSPSDTLKVCGADAELAALMRFPTYVRTQRSGGGDEDRSSIKDQLPIDCDTGLPPKRGHLYRYKSGPYHSDYLINFCQYPHSVNTTVMTLSIYDHKTKTCANIADPSVLRHTFTHRCGEGEHTCTLYTDSSPFITHHCNICL